MCSVDFFEVIKEMQYIHEELYSEESLKKINISAVNLARSLIEESFSDLDEIEPEKFIKNLLKGKPWILEPWALCQEIL